MRVNKKQLAEVFGISERTFTAYQKDTSFPILEANSRGKANVYDTEDVFRWLKDRAEGQGQETAKERLDRIRGDREELALAKDVDELVPAELVEQQLEDIASAIRSAVMFGNTKLKKDLDTEYAIDIEVEILNEHSRQILTHLSALEGEPEEGGEAGPEEVQAA